MLLSFAQFEREVTGERIRDKIAASKKKGMCNGPAFIVDQRRLLARMELTVVHYLAGVNWVREQGVEMAAREGLAAAFGAIRCCPAFRP